MQKPAIEQQTAPIRRPIQRCDIPCRAAHCRVLHCRKPATMEWPANPAFCSMMRAYICGKTDRCLNGCLIWQKYRRVAWQTLSFTPVIPVHALASAAPLSHQAISPTGAVRVLAPPSFPHPCHSHKVARGNGMCTAPILDSISFMPSHSPKFRNNRFKLAIPAAISMYVNMSSLLPRNIPPVGATLPGTRQAQRLPPDGGNTNNVSCI